MKLVGIHFHFQVIQFQKPMFKLSVLLMLIKHKLIYQGKEKYGKLARVFLLKSK